MWLVTEADPGIVGGGAPHTSYDLWSPLGQQGAGGLATNMGQVGQMALTAHAVLLNLTRTKNMYILITNYTEMQ